MLQGTIDRLREATPQTPPNDTLAPRSIVCAKSFLQRAQHLRANIKTRRTVISVTAAAIAVVFVGFAINANPYELTATARTETVAEQGVSGSYVVAVDGVPVGAADDKNTLQTVVDGVLASYATSATEAIEYENALTVEPNDVPYALTRDADVIRTLVADRTVVVRTDRVRTEVPTPFETVEIPDDTMYAGETTVLEEGVSGVRVVVERVTYRNNVEVGRESSAGAVLALPVSRVVAVGTIERPRETSYGEYIWCVDDAVVSSYFGSRSVDIGSTNHQGIDLAGYRGQDIYAADGGTVIFAGEKSGFGNIVQIEHDNGDITYYAHCDSLVACEGDKVARGDVIAKMGSTGVSSGVHCHFELHPGGGAPVNPLRYLP